VSAEIIVRPTLGRSAPRNPATGNLQPRYKPVPQTSPNQRHPKKRTTVAVEKIGGIDFVARGTGRSLSWRRWTHQKRTSAMTRSNLEPFEQ
jgi:hypothetical protein